MLAVGQFIYLKGDPDYRSMPRQILLAANEDNPQYATMNPKGGIEVWLGKNVAATDYPASPREVVKYYIQRIEAYTAISNDPEDYMDGVQQGLEDALEVL